MRDIRSERAEYFWQLRGLPRWEQVTFAAVNMPFGIVTAIFGLVLFIPFHVMILLVLPFMILTLVGSALWISCLAVMLGLSFVTEQIPVLRPFTFIIALPFLIVAHNLNGQIPAPTLGDLQAKVEKWDLIEAFPLTWSLLRFSIGHEGRLESGKAPVKARNEQRMIEPHAKEQQPQRHRS